MESRVGLSGAVDAMMPGAVDATEPVADALLRAPSPPADRTYTHGLDRSQPDRDGNPHRAGPKHLAADDQFAAG